MKKNPKPVQGIKIEVDIRIIAFSIAIDKENLPRGIKELKIEYNYKYI